MKLSDSFKFGKYGPKGKYGSPESVKGRAWTLEEVLNCEEGREYLWWYVEQPCTNSAYSGIDKASKDSVRRKLERIEAPQKPETCDPQGTITMMQKLDEISAKLDKLIESDKKTDKIISSIDGTQDGKGWDD